MTVKNADTLQAARERLWQHCPAHIYLVMDPEWLTSEDLLLDKEYGRIVASSLSEAESLLDRGAERGDYPCGCLLVEYLEPLQDKLDILFD